VYEIIRPEYKVMQSGGGERIVPEKRRTFHTGAGLLRWALNERLLEHRVGGVPYPTRFSDKWLGEPGRPGSGYGMIDTFCRWKFTPEHREAMQRAAKRYKEIVHYLREVEPEWRPDTSVSATGEIHYADNSTELHEINKYGGKRHRMLAYPSGDACF
jgi:hypothetical protein